MHARPSRLTPYACSALWLLALLVAAAVVWAAVASGSTSANTTAAQSRSSQQGVSIVAGPLTNVQLNRPYTYKLRIVTDRSYSEAYVGFLVPSACLDVARVMKLTAHQPQTAIFKVTFLNTYEMKRHGIDVTITSSPNGKKARFILSKTFGVTPAPPNQVTSTPKQCKYYIGKSPTGV
jgi:hypothetical protein